MSEQSLRSKATSGFIWNAAERFSVTIGQFVIGIVLARLLMPEDFGLIGMLSIFIALSHVFIQSGMGSGLIQKQDRTEKDYSTVFIFNLVVSTLCYIILYVTAPVIASFYEMPQLIPLTRVLGLSIIINAFAVVQRTKLEIEVDFKTLAKINVIALLTGGGVAIVAAVYGMGVWSLVIQTLLISVTTVIGLWVLGSWSFSIVFSKESFKQLFGYGSKLLAAGIYSKSLQEVYNLVIGKAYSASELGFFVQAKKLSEKPSGILTSVLQKVSFPILTALQDDEEKMISVYRQMIKMAAYLTLPSLTLLAILAEPIIVLLITDKWLPAVPLLQLLCIVKMFYPIGVVNMNILNAIGRSDLFLKIDLLKFPLIVSVLIIAVPISLEAIVIGQVITALISYFINAYLPGKYFGYGSIDQLKDILPMILITIGMAAVTLLSINYLESNLFKIIIGVVVGTLSYWIFSYLLKLNELNEIVSVVRTRLNF